MRQQNDLLNQLTASVSHELIIPIRCIITYATILLKRLHTEEDAKMITCVLRTAQMLQSYTKDLLDRALIENGTMKPNRTIDRISKVVNQCVEIARFQSDSRNVTIEVCHKGDVADEPLVLVDVQRIT